MRNRVKTATPDTRQHIDTKADDIDLKNGEYTPVSENTTTDSDGSGIDKLSEQETKDEFDDSWLDELEPYEPEEVSNPPLANSGDKNTTPSEELEDGTEAQKRRLEALYNGLEHVEEDVATEIYGKIVTPEISRLEAQLKELTEKQRLAEQAKMGETLTKANNAIFKKYPKAKTILQSKQFIDYLKSISNPYANESEHDILMRAYYSGDANYVIKKLDSFVETRGKPKPPVGVEFQQGGGQGEVDLEQKKEKPMTEEEYLRRKLAIRSAPRGTYPPNALKNLVAEYERRRG